MNNFIVGISTGNKDVKMSAGEIECSVLNFDFYDILYNFEIIFSSLHIFMNSFHLILSKTQI